jgi:RNA polymerase sigma-70 factor, ECF subfamily
VTNRENEWAELLRAANAGDAAAYDRCLRGMSVALRGSVRRAMARIGGSSADVEDIVQEVLLSVHLKRHTWDETRPLGPWLQTIARHKVIDALRRRGRRLTVPLEDIVESIAAPEPEPAARGQDLARALARLPEGQRNVVRTIAMEGATHAQAAQRLGVSEGAVRVALHRGLAALSRHAKEQT